MRERQNHLPPPGRNSNPPAPPAFKPAGAAGHWTDFSANMNKRDALRLKPGDIILYGDSMWSRLVDQHSDWQRGEVIHVTPRGGIKVVHLGPASADPAKKKKRQHVHVWVPYHHVHSKRTVKSRPARS